MPPAKRSTRKPAAKAKPEPAQPQRETPKYYRNLHGCQANLRIGDRKLSFAPRGMRGDIFPVKDGEEWEDTFIANNGVLFEIITSDEAHRTISNQTNNQQSGPETSRDKLRNLRKNEIINPRKENLDPEVSVESEEGHSIKMATKTRAEDGSTQIYVTREGIFNQPEGTTEASDFNPDAPGIGPKIVHRPGSENGPALQKPPENLPPEQVGDWLNEQRAKLFNPNGE